MDGFRRFRDVVLFTVLAVFVILPQRLARGLKRRLGRSADPRRGGPR